MKTKSVKHVKKCLRQYRAYTEFLILVNYYYCYYSYVHDTVPGNKCGEVAKELKMTKTAPFLKFSLKREIIILQRHCLMETQARHSGSCLLSPYFGRLRQADHPRSGVQDQPGQHGETPSL